MKCKSCGTSLKAGAKFCGSCGAKTDSTPAPQVMISFSSKNVPAVEKILRRIEDAGLRCWVSHRDIKQGQNYQGSITAAIRDASAVVFVLCKEFNLSEETKRELSLASSFKKHMVPIRTEAFTFSDELVYVLATVQYIDAFPDFDAALHE